MTRYALGAAAEPPLWHAKSRMQAVAVPCNEVKQNESQQVRGHFIKLIT